MTLLSGWQSRAVLMGYIYTTNIHWLNTTCLCMQLYSQIAPDEYCCFVQLSGYLTSDCYDVKHANGYTSHDKNPL